MNTSNTPQTLVEPSFAQGLVFSQHMYLMSQHNTGNSFFSSFSIEIFIHTKDDIKRVQQIMPKIGQLKGATEVHLLVFEDGNRKKIFQVIVHGGQFGSKNLIWMIRIFEIYCSQGMILNSCAPPPYFCSPNLQFQGISFSFNHFVMVGHMEVGVFLIENNFVL